MPASRSASMPAAIASWVSRPRAGIRSASMPNSSPRSNSPARPASLITSAGLSIVSKRAPDSPLTSRVMCLSSISWRIRVGIDIDPLLAVQDAGDVAVVEHAWCPGRPRAAPVMTTGSAVDAASPARPATATTACSATTLAGVGDVRVEGVATEIESTWPTPRPAA